MATASYNTVLELAQQLAPEEQDQLIHELQEARRLVTEDAEWDAVFARSHDQHQKLAAKLRADLAAGRSQPLDLDQL